MKSLAVLCLLSMVALSMAKPSGCGCDNVVGTCARERPERTYVPKPTCEVCNAVKEEDYSASCCNPQTIRHTDAPKQRTGHHECSKGRHLYTVSCDHKLPEPTCDVRNPVKEQGIVCDYSACHCDSPNIRDTKSGNCVAPDECPKKE